MNLKNLILKNLILKSPGLAAALLLPLAAAGAARAAETDIRQGKNIDAIVGKAGAPMAFTLQGAPSDIAVMRLADGTVLFWGTLDELNRGLSHGPEDPVPLSGGAPALDKRLVLKPVSVNFSFAAVSAGFNGAAMFLYRGNELLDADRIIVR